MSFEEFISLKRDVYKKGETDRKNNEKIKIIYKPEKDVIVEVLIDEKDKGNIYEIFDNSVLEASVQGYQFIDNVLVVVCERKKEKKSFEKTGEEGAEELLKFYRKNNNPSEVFPHYAPNPLWPKGHYPYYIIT